MAADAENSGSRARWYPLLIVAAIILVFGQTLFFGFVNYDDDELVYHNAAYLENWGNCAATFTTHAFAGAGGTSIYYRPILVVSTIVDYHLWGLRPFGYHLTNLVLHCCASLLLFSLAFRLLADHKIAFLSALLYAIHPVQTEAVAWIAGRNDLLLGVFVLLMVLAYERFRNSEHPLKWKILAIAAFAFALFTKESAAFYLLLLPLFDLTTGKRSLKSIFSVDGIIVYTVLGIILLGYLLIRNSIFGAVIGAENLYGSTPVTERIARIPAIVAEHLMLLIVPFRLSVAHPLHELGWLKAPWSIVAIIIMLLIPLMLNLAGKADRRLLFGCLWLCTGLLPVLGIIPMPLPILEHRLYVPAAGAALAASILAGTGGGKFISGKSIRIALLMICVLFGIISYVRLPVWKNGVTLFEDAIVKAPTDLRSYYSLATAYQEKGMLEKSIGAMERYVSLSPEDLRGTLFLRELDYRTGRKEDVLRICLLMQKNEPGNPVRMLETGVAYEELERPDSAQAWYLRGLSIDPTNSDLTTRLAEVETRLHKADDAIGHFRGALRLDPSNEDALLGLARALLRQGKTTDAIDLLKKQLDGGKASAAAAKLLVTAYYAAGDSASALRMASRYRLTPPSPER